MEKQLVALRPDLQGQIVWSSRSPVKPIVNGINGKIYLELK